MRVVVAAATKFRRKRGFFSLLGDVYNAQKMAKTRISVETSASSKAALDGLLVSSGLSPQEWLDLQIADGASTAQARLFNLDAGAHEAVDLANLAQVIGALRSVDWGFGKATTDYLSHDIHPYPAKFIPQIPRYLISILSRRGELVWDPFAGSGTTALEATLMGRRCISTDINALSSVIGKAKTLTLTSEDDRFVTEFLAEIKGLLAERGELAKVLLASERRWTAQVPPIPNIEAWFHTNAIRELAYLRWRLLNLSNESLKTLAWAALSRSILRASYQDAETRYVAKRRDVSVGEVTQIFATHLDALHKKVRSLGPLLHFRKPEFTTLDLRTPISESGVVTPASVDLVVTSPPYPNATDYHLYHRFRLFWLGHDPRLLANEEIGSHLRHQKQGHGFDQYLGEMAACLANIRDALRPARFAALVLGDAMFDGKIYHTALEVAALAKRNGLRHVATVDRPLHATKRSFVTAARRLRIEQLVILQKPTREIKVSVSMPWYRMWPYEENLRREEFAALTGVKPKVAKDGTMTAALDAMQVHALRRLTFSREYRGEDYASERTWQSILENGDQTSQSTRKDPKYATHGIHPYKGKFYPQLAKSLFNLAAIRPGSTVLDPFCGSGTVILEAYLNGLRGVGADVNPFAISIARAKLGILGVAPEKRDRALARYEARLLEMPVSFDYSTVLNKELVPELRAWFPDRVLSKMAWVISEIEQVGDARTQDLLNVLVSSIVRDVSQQEPKDLRIRRRARALSDAPVQKLLLQRVREARNRLRRLAEVANSAPFDELDPRLFVGDVKSSSDYKENNVPPGSIDLIVTSPPYATALPYIDTDRLSMLLLLKLGSSQRQALEDQLIGNREIRQRRRSEIDAAIEKGDWSEVRSKTARRQIAQIYALNKEADVGFRRKNTGALLYLYFKEMSLAFANMRSLLRRGGNALVVIGDNRTVAGGKEIAIESATALSEIGRAVGWKLKASLPITVTQENRLHNRNSIKVNEVLWFVSP